MGRLTVLWLTAFLAACVPAKPQHVTVTTDEFSKNIEVVGISEWYLPPDDGTAAFWHLRSWVDKESRATTHQLVVEVHYVGVGYSHFSWAADDTARSLEVVRLTHSKDHCSYGLCSYWEAIGVTIPDDLLRTRAATGFRIKVSARDGDAVILSVSAHMIGLQLAAVDKLVAS